MKERAVKPYVFASLVVVGLIPCIHWALIANPFYRDKLYAGNYCRIYFIHCCNTLSFNVCYLFVRNDIIILLVWLGILLLCLTSTRKILSTKVVTQCQLVIYAM